MTFMVLTASFLTIAGPGDISGFCKKIELATEVEEKDVTTFTSLGWKTVTGGIASGSLGIEVFNDLTDNGFDEDMWTLFTGRVPVAFTARVDNAAVGATNPNWNSNVLVNKWNPIAGSVGDVNGASYTYPLSGAVARAVS